VGAEAAAGGDGEGGGGVPFPGPGLGAQPVTRWEGRREGCAGALGKSSRETGEGFASKREPCAVALEKMSSSRRKNLYSQ